jgi:hypothetical protein
MRKEMKLLRNLGIAAIVLFAFLQATRPRISTKPATAELQAPIEVKRIFEKDCYSCHSDQRRLSWFDEGVPGYWLVRHDILTGREHLNFSTIGSKPDAAQKAMLYEAVNMVQLGAMPLPAFLRLHPAARVTPAELVTLKTYLAPWSTLPSKPVSAETSIGRANERISAAANLVNGVPERASLASVQPEFNGLPFDPSFEYWQLISATDRGDNNTLRFILGNETAIKAARTGNISPWPDNSRFAKIAWQQELGPDGLVYPARFIQVEFMVKNAKLYKSTDGWGWGRWRGFDLKPYGRDPAFVGECTGCHQPLSGSDYVYTLPITKATVAAREVLNRKAAEMPASLPYQPLGWGVITMYVDPQSHTTAILFGNDAAVRAARAVGKATVGQAKALIYPPTAVVALVTWAQRDDPHWFGGRIPDAPELVEFVQVSSYGNANEYRRFAGLGLTEDHTDASLAERRMTFILGLTPIDLP